MKFFENKKTDKNRGILLTVTVSNSSTVTFNYQDLINFGIDLDVRLSFDCIGLFQLFNKEIHHLFLILLTINTKQ